MGEYSYAELLDKAVNGNSEDRLNLFKWFERYGSDFWNGESYKLEDGNRLYPVYEYDEENDEYNIVDAEIR